ncbi:MAG: hypothetical protein R3E95_21345 [Thiolinea sp.]
MLVDVFREDLRAGKLAALIPIQVGRLQLLAPQAPVSYVQVKIRKQSPRSVLAHFMLLDAQGHPVAELRDCRFRGVQFACRCNIRYL